MEPIISIIIPCYNVQNYIDRCMDSLVHQTIGVENLEIILVNDASTDGTYEKLLSWEQRFPDSVLVINCAENHRQGAARNLGVSYARGTYLAFVDADDWVELDMCQQTIEKADTYQADMVMFNYDRPASDGSCTFAAPIKEGYVEIKTAQDRITFLEEHRHSICWGMIYSRLWYLQNNLSFPEDLYYEDIIVFLFFAHVRRFYSINRYLYHYFVNTESTTQSHRNPLDRLPASLMLYRKMYELPFAELHALTDFCFYFHAFCHTCPAIVAAGSDVFESICFCKETLLKTVPDITDNPYYTGKLQPRLISWELLAHPLIENDITPEACVLLEQRLRYSLNIPELLNYLFSLNQAQHILKDCLSAFHKISTDALSAHISVAADLQEIADGLLSICHAYDAEAFAHHQQAAEFDAAVRALFSDMLPDGNSADDSLQGCLENHSSLLARLSDLIADFEIAITLPEDV